MAYRHRMELELGETFSDLTKEERRRLRHHNRAGFLRSPECIGGIFHIDPEERGRRSPVVLAIEQHSGRISNAGPRRERLSGQGSSRGCLPSRDRRTRAR
jgi:hypothetical protein